MEGTYLLLTDFELGAHPTLQFSLIVQLYEPLRGSHVSTNQLLRRQKLLPRAEHPANHVVNASGQQSVPVGATQSRV